MDLPARDDSDQLAAETIGSFLHRLAAHSPSPGGGTSAALHAAQAAALIAMVARYTSGERYAEHASRVEQIIDRADTIRLDCLELAAADSAAFDEVAAAYKLPTDTDAAVRARKDAVSRALVIASRPQIDVIAQAWEITCLAAALTTICNKSVITDVAAASEAARAAATTARLNIEVNVRAITGDDARTQLALAAADVDRVISVAADVEQTVRKYLSR